MDYEKKPSDPLFRDAIPTPLSEDDLAFYLRMAWKELYNEDIKKEQLCILWCHTSLEIGRGKFIFNNNFGNIKRKEGVTYTSYKCNEIINGKTQWFEPYHPQTFFQHWDTATEGAKAYLQFLNKKRYQLALAALREGNISKYCAKLKEGGYITADLNYYTNLMLKLAKSFDKKSEQFMTFIPKDYKPLTNSEKIDSALEDHESASQAKDSKESKIKDEKAITTLPSAPNDPSEQAATIIPKDPKIPSIEVNQRQSIFQIIIKFLIKFLNIFFKK